MTVFGPYDTETQAAAAPMPTAVRALPISGKTVPGGALVNPNAAMRDLQLSHLREACNDAGIELGRYDARILAWLATYEPATVQVVIGLISRASAADIRRAEQLTQAITKYADVQDEAGDAYWVGADLRRILSEQEGGATRG